LQCRGPAARRDPRRVSHDPRGQLAVSGSERRSRSVGEAYTHANTEGNADARTHTDASPDRNPATDRQADTQADADPDPETDPNAHADPDPDPETDPNADAGRHDAPGLRRVRTDHRLRLRFGV
jgi:hypothetical protein